MIMIIIIIIIIIYIDILRATGLEPQVSPPWRLKTKTRQLWSQRDGTDWKIHSPSTYALHLGTTELFFIYFVLCFLLGLGGRLRLGWFWVSGFWDFLRTVGRLWGCEVRG